MASQEESIRASEEDGKGKGSMQLELSINGRTDERGRYLSWTPSPCELRVLDPEGATSPVAVTLRAGAGSVAGLVFRDPGGAPPGAELTLTLPVDGTPVAFSVAGELGRASLDDRDTTLEIVEGDGAPVASVPVMVRVRKNATALTPDERDRFIAAFALLNNRGDGPFRAFRDMHVREASEEAHFEAGFLPWHRAYLLDLERSLQAIDPSVALPYWRFDQPAPALFHPDFLGDTLRSGMVRFAASNPLQFWATDGSQGVLRRPWFDPAAEPARTDTGVPVLTEEATLLLGERGGHRYGDFVVMERQPHGAAHVSFDGFISDIPSAVRDPLFFLLHANVDRLWAKWQWLHGRFDPALAASYVDPVPGRRIGHNVADTMWPWNEITSPPRPPTAPGGPLEGSPATAAPGPQPAVQQMIDLQGRFGAAGPLGYDYDDVPFE